MQRIFRSVVIAFPLLTMSLAATAASGSIMVSKCWIRSMPASVPSGGYFELMNMSDKPIDLVGVSTDAFGMSMLHQTQTSGSTSKMVMVDKVTVPANGKLAFTPGSYHLMLEQPAHPIKVGSTIPMTFKFSDGEQVASTCAVRNASGMADMQGMKGMSGMSGMSK